jgi:hypothetical protein
MFYFESDNVNDILSVAQKQTVVSKILQPGQSFKALAVAPFVQNHADNPTLFRQEIYGAPVLADANATWPGNMAAEDNPFGIEAVQGQDILSAHEKTLLLEVQGSLDNTGWTENYGIGV